MPDRWDVLGGAGAVLVVIGLAVLHVSAGLIVSGAALVGVAVLGAKRFVRTQRHDR
jgi:hypothetical protein